MKPSDDYLIAAYLRDEFVSEEEQQLFSRRLKEDPEFREKVVLEEQMFNSFNEDRWSAITDTASEELRTYKEGFEDAEVDAWKQTISDAMSSTRSLSSKRKIAYAIAAVLLIALLPLYLFLGETSTSEELYADYADFTDLPTLVVRGETDEIEQGKIAQQYFDAGNYSETATILEHTLIEEEDPNALLLVYLGISQMELDRFEDAENSFSQLQDLNALESERAYWYLALLQIKKGHLNDAKILLEEIVAQQYFNHQKAQELLREIE